MKKLIFIFSALLLALTSNAHAQMRLDITKGTVEPVAIAVPDFVTTNPGQAKLARDIPQIYL